MKPLLSFELSIKSVDSKFWKTQIILLYETIPFRIFLMQLKMGIRKTIVSVSPGTNLFVQPLQVLKTRLEEKIFF